MSHGDKGEVFFRVVSGANACAFLGGLKCEVEGRRVLSDLKGICEVGVLWNERVRNW